MLSVAVAILNVLLSNVLLCVDETLRLPTWDMLTIDVGLSSARPGVTLSGLINVVEFWDI
jgi:hypothetical protein